MPEPGRISDDDAAQYDGQCRQMEWHGHEALFGMTFEYVRPGQSILDLGTGTGLSAALFHKAGLEVYGADSSEEMLRICAAKNLTKELKVCDLSQPDWPYGRDVFDHVTCCGLLHFIGNLDIAFAEVRRILKRGGTFGFTVKGVLDGKTAYVDPGSGIRVHCHSERDVEGLMAWHGFEPLKRMIYWTYNDFEKTDISYFTLYVVKKV